MYYKTYECYKWQGILSHGCTYLFTWTLTALAFILVEKVDLSAVGIDL